MRPAEVRQHISERFRLAGRDWAKKKGVADLLDELKGPTREAMKTALLKTLTEAGEKKVPEARLEREVESSDEWHGYIKGMCAAREDENAAWVERRAIELEMSEQIDGNANYRTERKMS